MMGRFGNGFIIMILMVILLPYCEKPAITDEPSPFEIYCDSLELAGVIDSWLFPILPGTPEYEALTPEQRDSVMQIPESVLENMCTPGLIETCFNYPHLSYCTIYSSFQSWWWVFNDNFNGIVELVTRVDAPKRLLDEYLEFSQLTYFDTLSYNDKREIAIRLSFLEIALAQESVLSNLTNEQLLSLINKALEIISQKSNDLDPWISPAYSCYILARMMYYEDYLPFISKMQGNEYLSSFVTIGNYIFTYHLVGSNVHEDIMNSINSFITIL